jgi:hypothetical protein
MSVCSRRVVGLIAVASCLAGCRQQAPQSTVNTKVEVQCNPARHKASNSKWGYAKREGYCEGLVADSEPEAAGVEAGGVELLSFTLGLLSPWPFYGLRYRVHWPASPNPVTIRATSSNWRERGGYRFDAIVQGPYFDWSTDVLRATRTATVHVVAKTTERIGGKSETIYLPVHFTDLYDDDEPLPLPTKYLLLMAMSARRIRDAELSVTPLTPDGAPAGERKSVEGFRRDRPVGGWIPCQLEFAKQPPGLYRVQLTGIDDATQQPVNMGILMRHGS